MVTYTLGTTMLTVVHLSHIWTLYITKKKLSTLFNRQSNLVEVGLRQTCLISLFKYKIYLTTMFLYHCACTQYEYAQVSIKSDRVIFCDDL